MPIQIGYSRHGREKYNRQLFGAASIQGRREAQEDDYLVVHASHGGRPSLLAVCDGMGGGEAGQLAAATAVNALAEKANEIKQARQDKTPAVLVKAVKHAQQKILDEFNALSRLASFRIRGGTTVVTAAIKKGGVHILHAGDSRAYLIAKGRALQLTVDHALKDAPNVLTNHLGSSVAPVLLPQSGVKLKHGDALVLCTDGVWNKASAEEIAAMVDSARSAQDAAERIIRLVQSRKPGDNATAVVYFHRIKPKPRK